MLHLLGATLLLGIGGFDPTAALIAVAALAAGARPRDVMALGVVVMVGLPLFGSTLALVVGPHLGAVDWWILVPRGRVGAVVVLVVGLALLAYAIVRLRRPGGAPTETRRTRIGTVALTAAGATFVVSLLADPAFVAGVVLATRASRPVEVIVLISVWTVLSQSALIVVLVSVAGGRQRVAVERFHAWWSRARPVVGRIVTGVLLVAGALLVVDAVWWFAAGHFLLPEPRR